MIEWKRYTVIFICLTILSIAAYDVLAILQGGLDSSISATLIEWSYKYPAFTFLVGFTMGHIFWRYRDTETTRKISESTKE